MTPEPSIRLGYAAGDASRTGAGGPVPESPRVPGAARDGSLPCSFAQEQFWFVDQLAPGSAAFNFSWPVRLRGRLDTAALERALTEVVRRHEALRTGFALEDDQPVQVVAPAKPFSLRIVDLAAAPVPDEEAKQLVESEAQRPFDLRRGGLFRAQLLRLSEDEHVFHVVVHHIVFDEWSKVVLFRELGALYAAFRAGTESPLPAPALQYADFAASQRERLTDDVLREHLAYWVDELRGVPTALDLPVDRPRPAVAGTAGARRRLPLPDDAAASLEALARDEGATFFEAALALLEVLLHRVTRQDDFLVGLPADTRSPAFDETIGVLLNTVVLRSDLGDRPTFRELLRRVHRRVLAAAPHAELPFELLVRELQPVRDLSRHPLFHVLLAVNPPEPRLELPGLETEELQTETTAAQVDLFLFIQQRDGGYDARWDYSAELFDEVTVDNLHTYFVRLLNAAVEDPDRPVDELPLLAAGEREQLLATGRGPEVTYPEATLHALVEAQVARTPDAIAVSAPGAEPTYAELDARANLLAHRLRLAGVDSGSLVAVALQRSPELVVAALGVLKAGGAYVPLDPELPADRLEFMLADSSAAVLVTTAALEPRLPQHAGVTLHVDAAEADAAADRSAPLAPSGGPDDVAYVIYTSGSTGRPKGVLNTHRGIVNRLLSMQDTYALGPSDRLLQKTQSSFDVSVRELFWPLLVGARIVVAAPGEQGNPRYLAEVVERERITTLHFVPSMLQLFVEQVDPERFRTVRCVLSGGEALPNDLVRAFFARFDCELHNLYGPTEAAVSVSAWRCRADDRQAVAPIGRPVANTQIYVVSDDLEPVPVGIWGEILVGGVQVARGYHERPDLTERSFVPNPFGPGRLYRTGDLGRWNADGALEFGGRMDDQVKLRGFRVELGEIEAVLREHPAVANAAVVAVDTAGPTELAAYLVAADGDERLVPEVLSFLRTKLPDYMVPASVTLLDELPLLPNGKLDRTSLPDPERPAPGDDYVEPATETEQRVAAMWQDLLDVERVGRSDDFFSLGGHSLLAARLVGRVCKAFDVDLPLCTFLREPTVAALAAELEQADPGSQAQLPPLVARAGRREASFAQERFWFVDEVMGRSAAYNIPLALRLRGELSVDALQRALAETVRRHEILRTRFAPEGDRLVQIVDPARGISLPLTDLGGEADPLQKAQALVDERAQTPLDPTATPLFHASLLRLGERDHILQLVFSHLVFDGVSRVVLLRELASLYNAFSAGRGSPLHELELQYGDYAEWQRSWLEGELLEQELAYWKESLADIPSTLELPTDRPRPATASLRGAWSSSTIPARTVEALQALARHDGASLYMTLLAAFDVLLSRYSGQEDIVLGMPVDSRDRAELDEAIGVFVDTVVLRVDVSGRPMFRELLGRVRARVLEAIAHQRLPFERLVRELQPERHLGRHPLYQVMLTLVPSEGLPELVGLEASEVVAQRASSPIDLTVFLEERDGLLETTWEYSTDLFDRETIERMQGHFARLLDAVVADPDCPVDELPLSPEEERGRLVAASSRLVPEYPVACLHELFEARAAATPDAGAVTYEGQTLTYRELDERANRLAHRLRGLGVRPDVLVALCLPRSLELAVAILGVLKAGGAYVPLDPEYPAERLAFVLADSGAPVAITVAELLPRLPASAATVVCLDRDEELATLPTSRPEPLARPENLAYVIYTSGSTGQPKGVLVEHRQVARLFTATNAWFSFRPQQTWTLLHSYAFDFSVWELWGALLHGGRVVVVPFWTARSPEALARLLIGERVTFFNATPSLFTSVQEELIRVGDELALEIVVFGGEALQPQSLRPWFARFGDTGARLVNMYGITETTVHVTYRPLSAADCERTSSPIGEPIPDLQLYLLDGKLDPVPAGLPGEIFVGGSGVARGYLNRPELSAERFVPNPFGSGRLYRSGDSARLRSDGELEFLGRIDDQVKIRGFRIELGEIQAVLLEHDGVAECAVVALEAAPGDTRLAAYVVPTSSSESEETLRQQLRAFLEERLPTFMVPSSIAAVGELPLTANGKLDRRALPEPTWVEQADEGDTFVAPRTPLEAEIAEVWCQVLDVERVGTGDNFFHLGGHSLLAARVITRVRERFSIDLSVRALFEHPTLASFAEQVAARVTPGEDAPAADGPDERPPQAQPPSFSQQQLLVIDELAPTIATYNGALAVRIRGDLDRSVLERALRDVVERHESLRTVFRWEEEGPVQVVLDRWDVSLRVVDLTSVPPDRRESELGANLREESRRPFRLGSDLLLRPSLFVLGDDEHVLLCITHHIVSDGWSVGVFCRDLSELYAAHRQARPPRLPELPLRYRDFARWQRERLRGERLEAELGYWRGRLAGAPTVLRLPTVRVRPQRQTFEGASHEVMLPADLAAAVMARSREEDVTPYMLLLAVFGLLLYRRTGQDDILVGSPFANRLRHDFDELVGFFANTLVLRVQLGGNPRFSTLLKRVRETALEALEHQEVPFEAIVEAVRPQRSPGVNPLVQVNFRARVDSPATLDLPGAVCSRVTVDSGFAAFELAVDLHVLADGILGEVLYNVELFDEAEVALLAADYEGLLRQVLSQRDARLLDLELPSERTPTTVNGSSRSSSIRGSRASGEREAAGGRS